MDDAKANRTLEFEDDDMAKVTWFHAKNHERSFKKFNQWSSVKLYFGWMGKTSGFGPLRMKATYHGNDWTFARQLIVKIDDNDPVSFYIYNHRKSSVGSGGVWEYYDVPLAEKGACFDKSFSLYDNILCKNEREQYEVGPRLSFFCSPQMTSAKGVRVRFDGDRQSTFNLPSNQLADIKAVCKAYLALAR